MLKITIQEPIAIKASTLVLSFPSEGSSSAFCSSLLTTNNPFTLIGYYYSEYCAQSVVYCPQSSSVSFNGEVFFNSAAQITLIHFRNSAITTYQEKFHKELLDFIKANEFLNVFVLGSVSKNCMNDFEIRSVNVNVYYITNNDSLKLSSSSMLNFTEVFPVENRTKTFEEMKYIDGSSAAKKFIQALVLEKMKFAFVFAFSDELFDPLSGYAIYNKLESLLKLSKDNLASFPKKNKSKKEVLADIANNLKVDKKWDVYVME